MADFYNRPMKTHVQQRPNPHRWFSLHPKTGAPARRLPIAPDNIAPFQVMELVKRANSLAAAGKPVIHMSIGEPDFTAPPGGCGTGGSCARRPYPIHRGDRHRAPAAGDIRLLRTAVRRVGVAFANYCDGGCIGRTVAGLRRAGQSGRSGADDRSELPLQSAFCRCLRRTGETGAGGAREPLSDDRCIVAGALERRSPRCLAGNPSQSDRHIDPVR